MPLRTCTDTGCPTSPAPAPRTQPVQLAVRSAEVQEAAHRDSRAVVVPDMPPHGRRVGTGGNDKLPTSCLDVGGPDVTRVVAPGRMAGDCHIGKLHDQYPRPISTTAPTTNLHDHPQDLRNACGHGTQAPGDQRRPAEPASGHRPRRDQRMGRVARRRHRRRRRQARPLRHAAPARAGPRAPGRRPAADHAPTTSTPSRPSASRGSPATSTSSGGSAPTSAGTPR